MSYVKTVIDAHKGKIKVESTLGKGSVFTVEVPLFNGAA
jgi:two-component system phosphate regulon sensor histidine kinase PhoR